MNFIDFALLCCGIFTIGFLLALFWMALEDKSLFK